MIVIDEKRNFKEETESGYFVTYPAYVVECDCCPKRARKCDKDPGEAAEKARKEGFDTVRGADAVSPRKWLCLSCITERNA